MKKGLIIPEYINMNMDTMIEQKQTLVGLIARRNIVWLKQMSASQLLNSDKSPYEACQDWCC